MAWSKLAGRLNKADFSLILAGPIPILQPATPGAATIWGALKQPAKVGLFVVDRTPIAIACGKIPREPTAQTGICSHRPYLQQASENGGVSNCTTRAEFGVVCIAIDAVWPHPPRIFMG
jgi:hypothetical protein